MDRKLGKYRIDYISEMADLWFYLFGCYFLSEPLSDLQEKYLQMVHQLKSGRFSIRNGGYHICYSNQQK